MFKEDLTHLFNMVVWSFSVLDLAQRQLPVLMLPLQQASPVVHAPAAHIECDAHTSQRDLELQLELFPRVLNAFQSFQGLDACTLALNDTSGDTQWRQRDFDAKKTGLARKQDKTCSLQLSTGV